MRTHPIHMFAALSLFLLVGSTAVAAPEIPDADACQTVPQRSLVVLFATPSAGDTLAAATPTMVATDVPVDAQTTAAVTETTHAVIACLNAGDFWSLLTLVSDDYLRRSFVDGVPVDPLALELEPFINAVRGCQTCNVTPREGEDQLAIASIADLRTLTDGRVSLDLLLTSPSGANPLSMRVAFVAVGDRWLVDEIVGLES